MKDNFKRMLSLTIILTGLFLGLSNNVFAQEETAATVTGQVVDSNGGGIPNATVVVANIATGETRRVQTNSEGNYNVFPLSPGTYTISVEQSGFKKLVTT